MARTNDKRNNQGGSGFTPKPMDVPGVMNTFLSSTVSECLKSLLGEAKGVIDSRATSNLVKGKFAAMDIFLAYLNYREKMEQGMSRRDAAGEALMETLGGIVGAGIGMWIGGPIGATAGGYAFSKIGSISWQEFKEFLEALAEWSVKAGEEVHEKEPVNSSYAEKVRGNVREGTRRIDPLVIDLDGDGIELRDIKESRAFFDLSGSGFANRVGWVSPDDAFLVLDRNGNNRVDDISELFGSDRQSGFAELGLYDSNRDGRIDAFDEVFKNLKVWQDRDGDGRTDAGELLSLSEVGIKAIHLRTRRVREEVAGNLITEVGRVEFEGGGSTQAADVELRIDRLYGYYNREVELDPRVVFLPWVRGYGFLPDLPVAMSLDEKLLEMVAEAVKETDLAGLKEKFERIIYRWAGVENITEKELGVSWAILGGNDRKHRLLHFDGGVTLTYEQVGAVEKFSGMTPEEVREGVRHRSGRFLLEAWNTMFQGLFARFVVGAGILGDLLPATYDFFSDKIRMEDFSPEDFGSRLREIFSGSDADRISRGLVSLMVLREAGEGEWVSKFVKDNYNFLVNHQEIINNIYAPFVFNFRLGTPGDDVLKGSRQEEILVGLEGNDRIYGYEGKDVLAGGYGNDELYGGKGNDELYGGPGEDYLSGGWGDDTYHFRKGEGPDTVFDSYFWDTNRLVFEDLKRGEAEFVKDGADLVIRTEEGEEVRIKEWFWGYWHQNFDFEFADGEVVRREDLEREGYRVYGTGGDDRLEGSGVRDVMEAFSGDDELYGHQGNDILRGGEGKDKLYGGLGNDLLQGGDGGDELYGEKGDDTLVGGAGDDRLEGGPGNDTYVFRREDGKDVIYEKNRIYKADKDTYTDTLRLEGIDPAEVELLREGDDLVVRVKGSEDTVRIRGYFTFRDLDNPSWEWSWERYWGYAYDHKVDRIEFSDGRVFSLEEFIKEKGLVLRGTEEDDHLIGQEGKDFIYGEGGNDRIYGGEGDDTLVGGSGDDYLEGGPGNDTYIFKPGDGQDWIQDVEGENKIVFGTGIKGEEVEFAREKDEMIFNLGDGEEIRIASWPRVYEHFSFEFADGKRLKGEDIEARGYPIYGSPYDDFLEGTSGNDRIEGRGGRDVLLGGKGDDILEGGPGSDTYIFHPGDGKDVILDTTLNVPVEGGEIQETGSQPGMPPLIPGFMFEFSEMMPVDGERYFEGESNRVVLGEGVKRNEVVFFRRGEDLVPMYGEGDYVEIRDQFARGGVEWIELEDGAYLSRETISEIVETVNGLRDDGVTDLGRKYRELIGDQGLMEIIAGSWTDFSNPVQILRQPGMVPGGV